MKKVLVIVLFLTMTGCQSSKDAKLDALSNELLETTTTLNKVKTENEKLRNEIEELNHTILTDDYRNVSMYGRITDNLSKRYDYNIDILGYQYEYDYALVSMFQGPVYVYRILPEDYEVLIQKQVAISQKDKGTVVVIEEGIIIDVVELSVD